MPQEIKQRWTTPAALGRWMGVTSATALRWCKRGNLRAVCIQAAHYTDDRPRKTTRGVWRIYEADLLAFLAKMRSGAVPTRSLWRR